ncbi:MAG: HD domain-containing protein, partial [Myxococcales bacterium]|nr:HD domain-containing protein [Myxococcales bacterium]
DAVLAEGDAVQTWLADTEATRGTQALLLLPLLQKGQPLGLLAALRQAGRFTEGERQLGIILADRAAVAIQNARLFETLERTFVHTIEAFVTALEEKDRYTAGHSERVAEFAQVTAEAMGLDPDFCELCYQGGRLHDIGKLTLRPEDLNKPAALTRDEFERFKAHPGFGESLMRPIPAFRHILPAVGGHHERWDGKGYPRGIGGHEIPLIARIMAVADTYDAMTSHRAYRSALAHAIAIDEIRKHAGSQFDPEVVTGFLVGIERWREARRKAGREYPR